jgi:DNA repair photolyase
MAKKKSATGTREWAATSANVMLGCKHDCRYCYARASAARFGRKDPLLWPEEVVEPNLARKGYGKREGTVMFPTTHDITLENLVYTAEVLRKLLVIGNNVLVVSKPCLAVVKELCQRFEEYKAQILFRFTIGSRQTATLSLWEPGAPDYTERLESLKYAFEAGFATSVSMEPMLDTEQADIVTAFYEMEPYVTDAIWLGKMNKAVERLRRNGFGDDEALLEAARLLVESQSDLHIIRLYGRLKDEPKVKWKESIKAVVGLMIPMEVGLDI